ncbi:MAG: hypothetical protein IPL34_20460 [Thiofilum sp.]|uniref:hypothetical protein n=1 Tax=Thiofilum sp. TaxID=2212733 RepID=UPI0025ED181A|nr:hypothetical protein [Thiofilum sp.]MBK8455656.1 hypothetical protein [Thiofilum sp.]
MPFPILAAAAAIGSLANAAVSIYSGHKQADAEEAAAAKRAEQAEISITETNRRMEENFLIMQQNEEDFETITQLQASMGGTTDIGLGAMIKSRKIMADNIDRMREQVAFKNKMTRMGVQNDLDYVDQAASSMRIKGYGALGSAASSLYNINSSTGILSSTGSAVSGLFKGNQDHLSPEAAYAF